MAKGVTKADAIRSFAAEYRNLCLRHGLRVTFDGGYRASGVDVLNDNDRADDEWDLYPDPDIDIEGEL